MNFFNSVRDRSFLRDRGAGGIWGGPHKKMPLKKKKLRNRGGQVKIYGVFIN